MIFSKPNLKYTEMCIYVDSITAKEEPTEQELTKCFEYIYHIGFMLAHKYKYFNKSHYYEEFALYLATEVMYRLFLNPKLKELNSNGEPSLKKIKSVLNYMKAVIYGRKIEFEQQNYSQKLSRPVEGNNFSYEYNVDLYKPLTEVDVTLYLSSISKTIKHVVFENNHYKNDSILMKNIYISTLLTVLNSITFTGPDKEKLYITYSSIDSKYRLLSRMYLKNREESLTLYHLDDSFESYIKVLSNKVFKQIKEDITELTSQDFELAGDTITDIIFLEISGDDQKTEA